MNIRLIAPPASPSPRLSTTEVEMRSWVDRRHRRDRVYCAVEILIECLRMVQQHRGAVMGFLGKHRAFEKNMVKTCDSADAGLNILADFHDVIDKKSIVRISEEWRTARYVDKSDTALQQFEIHGHLATHLIHFIWQCVEEHDHLMKNRPEIRRLNEILLKDFLLLIDKTGQCRALATWLTSCDPSDPLLPSIQQKLGFIFKDIVDSLDLVYVAFSHLDVAISHPVFTLLTQYNCRYKIARLDELVHKSLLPRKGRPHISAESTFYLFTMAMDELYGVFRKMLFISQHQPDPSLYHYG